MEKQRKFIPFPVRLNGNDFISEMFLFGRIVSENLRTLDVEVEKYMIFMLDGNKKSAHIDINLSDKSNAVVMVDAQAPNGVRVYFYYNKKSENCLYEDFRQKKFLELVNMIKN